MSRSLVHATRQTFGSLKQSLSLGRATQSGHGPWSSGGGAPSDLGLVPSSSLGVRRLKCMVPAGSADLGAISAVIAPAEFCPRARPLPSRASRSLVHATRQTPACEEAHFVPGSCDLILTGAVSDRAPGTSWDPVQPWAARTGGGVTVASTAQGRRTGCWQPRRAWMHRHRWSRNGRRLLGSHHLASPPRSHYPGDKFAPSWRQFASTWRHSHEPGTHKMAVILAISLMIRGQ